jgi:MFS family permease
MESPQNNTQRPVQPEDVNPVHPTPSQALDTCYRFAVFNALSSQIVLASPMILYAKSLGASATVLGLIAGMMPLLVILQIPAAQHVLRVGYKRFMMMGWSARAFIIFGMALIPLTGGFLDRTTQLVLLLASLFLYNFLRGVSSGAWLPWVTGLVPAGSRGKYLTREQWCVNLAGALAFGLSAVLLSGSSRPWQFSLVFLFSGSMGLISLIFMKRIPDVEVPPEEASAKGPVPWLELSRFAPFRKILEGNIAWGIAYGGLQTFVVSFLRSLGGLSDAAVLVAMAAFYIGGMASAWVAGARMDRLGSKPILKFTMALLGLMCVLWCLIAGNVFKVNQAFALSLLFILGLGGTLFIAAQYRLAMVTIPKMGRSHFFALFSVVLNVLLGISPLAWGLLIDVIGPWHTTFLGMEWNRYSIFFGLVALAYVGVYLNTRRLEEHQAAPVEDLLQELLVTDPKRVLSRVRLGN